MPTHTLIPLAAAALGPLLVVASGIRRLPPACWMPTAVLGLSAIALPAIDSHYAADPPDLIALSSLTLCAHAATAHASRSRIAQLPLTWRRQVDIEWRRLNS